MRPSSPAIGPIRMSTSTKPAVAPVKSLLRMLRGEVKPVMAWGNRPMLPHVMRQGTDDHPNRELQARSAGDGGRARRCLQLSSPAFRMPISAMPGLARSS